MGGATPTANPGSGASFEAAAAGALAAGAALPTTLAVASGGGLKGTRGGGAGCTATGARGNAAGFGSGSADVSHRTAATTAIATTEKTAAARFNAG